MTDGEGPSTEKPDRQPGTVFGRNNSKGESENRELRSKKCKGILTTAPEPPLQKHLGTVM